MRHRRLGAALVASLAVAAIGVPDAASAREPHRHHRRRHIEQPAETPVAEAAPYGPATGGVPYASGYVLGLLDGGIGGTATALSPYVNYGGGYGYIRPGYDGPGFGTPGY